MMWDGGAFGCRGLGGANVEATIELGGVTGQDFTRELFCKIKSQSGFAGSGGADDGEKNRIGRIFVHGKRIWRERIRRIMRTTTARRREPRTCWRVGFIGRFPSQPWSRSGRGAEPLLHAMHRLLVNSLDRQIVQEDE